MSFFARALLTFVVASLPAQAMAFESTGGWSTQDPGPSRWIRLQALTGRLFDLPDDRSVEKTGALRFDRIVVGLGGGDALDARWAAGANLGSLDGAQARIGYAFGRFIAFGAAGAAFASQDFARDARRATATSVGWTIGGGVEAALFAGVSAKVEYLYVDLDRRALDGDGDVSLAPSGGQFRAGLNYRF